MLQSLHIDEAQASGMKFYKAVGCSKCLETGYAGRLPIFEIMSMTPSLAHLIIERADANDIQKQAVADGMTTLLSDGIAKIETGLTTVEEVLSVAAS